MAVSILPLLRFIDNLNLSRIIWAKSRKLHRILYSFWQINSILIERSAEWSSMGRQGVIQAMHQCLDSRIDFEHWRIEIWSKWQLLPTMCRVPEDWIPGGVRLCLRCQREIEAAISVAAPPLSEPEIYCMSHLSYYILGWKWRNLALFTVKSFTVCYTAMSVCCALH